jgi:hypothetical protein
LKQADCMKKTVLICLVTSDSQDKALC